jgi:hypothetical protein
LKAVHELDAASRNASALLQRPRVMDEVVHVFTELSLQLRTDRIRITAHVTVECRQICRFAGNDLRNIGVSLRDVHRHERHREPVKDQHGLHHGSGEFRIGLPNAQPWQHVPPDSDQSGDSEQAQRSDDRGAGDYQRQIEDRFKHRRAARFRAVCLCAR